MNSETVIAKVKVKYEGHLKNLVMASIFRCFNFNNYIV